jgi:midasin (ATPase involved in ribosome maturation)
LEYIQLITADYGFQRALYEGFSMSFLTQLNAESTATMEKLIAKHLLKKYAN